MSFLGKAFVIMGATSGVGSALARRLDAEGASLVLCARNGEALAEIAATVGGCKHTIAIDAASPSFEEELAAGLGAARDALGGAKFDGGAYCPGVSSVMPLRGVSKNLIDATFAVNYTGAVLFAKVMASKPCRAEASSIVLVSSVAARRGEKGKGVYGASKSALELAARCFALELAPFGARINCVAPGWLDTRMNAKSAGSVIGLEEKMKEAHPLGTGTAEDAAAAIAFLLSEDAKWITGSTLVVDGGYLA